MLEFGAQICDLSSRRFRLRHVRLRHSFNVLTWETCRISVDLCLRTFTYPSQSPSEKALWLGGVKKRRYMYKGDLQRRQHLHGRDWHQCYSHSPSQNRRVESNQANIPQVIHYSYSWQSPYFLVRFGCCGIDYVSLYWWCANDINSSKIPV